MENKYLLSWINSLDFHLLLLLPVHQQKTLSKYFTSYLVNIVTLTKSLATMDHHLTQRKKGLFQSFFVHHSSPNPTILAASEWRN